VILPKAIRDALNWPPGTELDVVDTADGVLLRRTKADADPRALDGLIGLLAGHARKPALTDPEISAAIDGMMRARLAPAKGLRRSSRKRPAA
jgi:AbrB family looped-hinge helix DNA binding protein